jgi:thioredoxin reductase (NADPH)
MNGKIIYDLIIIGGGPAGLTAAIYSSRARLATLVLEKGACGGWMANTELIENYPGFPEGTKGIMLANKFKEQALRFGATINEFEEVTNVKEEGAAISVRTSKKEYRGRSLIVASGSIPKKLGVPGEEELLGKGVSYCATCDGPLFKGKRIAVIGCGNSGLQEGEALLQHVSSITFVELLPNMTAEKILQERLLQHENTEFLLNHKLSSINGKDFVKSVTVVDRDTGNEKEIEVEGVFVYIGFLPNTEFLKGLVGVDRFGYITSDEDMRTSVAGIFAGGDIRSKKIRQITVACGEATVAALSAQVYLSEHTRR